MQNRLLAMNYIYEGEDDKLYSAHRYSFVLGIISLQFETDCDAFYNLVLFGYGFSSCHPYLKQVKHCEGYCDQESLKLNDIVRM